MSDEFSLRTSQVMSESFKLSSINNAMDLLNALRKFPNAGDRIELCFAFAQNRPDVALHSFATILNTNADRKIRALVLRSCGEILHPPTRREIVACQSQESRELLRFLAEEASGRSKYSSDLTQWAAATAIIQLGYNFNSVQHIELGGLQEEPEEIREKIVERRIEQGRRLDRYNTRNALSSEYREYLEFWAYGPTKAFFSEPSYHYGSADIRHILAFLRIHGLTLAFDTSSNQQVQREAYSLAKQIFEEYSTNRDPWLNRSLKRFVKSEYDDRAGLESLCQAINFKLKIKNYGNLSNLILDELRQAKTEVEAYEAYVVALFETAITVCADDYSVLANFIDSDGSRHLSTIRTQLSQINSTINELKQAQPKIATNSNLLNQAYDQVRNVDLELYANISNPSNSNFNNQSWLSSSNQDWSKQTKQVVEIAPGFRYEDKNIKTLAECQQVISSLNSRRKFVSDCCSKRQQEIKKNINHFIVDFLFHSGEDIFGVIIVFIAGLFFIEFTWWIYLIILAVVVKIVLENKHKRDKKEKILQIQRNLNSSWKS